MEITLNPEMSQRIRGVLGDDVDLAPGAVLSALARLSVEAPGVYSQILSELSGTQIRLDSERVLARRQWWNALRRRVFWWGVYESDAGDRLVAKRHVAASVPLGLAAVILCALAGSTAFRHHSPAAEAHAAATAVVPHPAFSLPRIVGSPRPLGGGPDRTAPLPALPTPPLGLPAWGAETGTPPAQLTSAAEPPRDPLVFNVDSGGSFGVATAAALRQPEPADTTAETSSPIVYERTDRASGDSPPGMATPSIPGAATGASGDARPRWTVGARVEARLATGVLVASGGSPSPAIAETTNPAATWLGQATLGADGRVGIAFALPQRNEAVRGVALDPDRLVPGLAGRTELRHPQAAAAALSAAAAAAAAYARALAQQGFAVAGSWGQLTVGQSASPWAYLAASAADGLAPRSGVPGPVETSEIPAGTPLLILVTEAP
jgi:hypothetical protein